MRVSQKNIFVHARGFPISGHNRCARFCIISERRLVLFSSIRVSIWLLYPLLFLPGRVV